MGRKPKVDGIKAKRNPEIGDALLESLFDETGLITPKARKLIKMRSDSRSDFENVLVRELLLFLWERLPDRSVIAYARILDATKDQASRLLRYAFSPILRHKSGLPQRFENEEKLEEIRFESQAEMVKRLWDYATKAMVRGADQIPQMTSSEALKAFKEFTEKALLMSGQATSRSSRMDESRKSNEELEQEILDLERRVHNLSDFPDLKVIDGAETA